MTILVVLGLCLLLIPLLVFSVLIWREAVRVERIERAHFGDEPDESTPKAVGTRPKIIQGPERVP